MSKVLKFTCLKVHATLLEYQKNKKIPRSLLNGDVTPKEIKQCLSNFDDSQQKDVKLLLASYKRHVKNNIVLVKHQLRKDYGSVIQNLQSRNEGFMFPEIMHRYRSDINPISALCYELKRCFSKYDTEDLYHQWLFNLLTDADLNKNIIHALKSDIFSLEKILDQYNILFEIDNQIPLELFHAKQKISDFQDHIKEIYKYGKHWE